MVKFVAAGNVMLDTVEFVDDSSSGSTIENIGGPATFAYAGIKLWTDDVVQCSKLGADYATLFDPWVARNGVDPTYLKVVCDKCNHSHMVYGNKNGNITPELVADLYKQRNKGLWQKGTSWEDFGYMKTSPEDIGEITKSGTVKGIYLAQNCDRTFWDKLGSIKARDGFKIMWEIEASVAYPDFLQDIRYCASKADVFSLNINEAQRLFGVEGDEACIKELQKFPFDLTLFRVGDRGLYSVTRDRAYYLPPAPCTVVDPTGCGNTSTGSALYAYASGENPLMVGIMANVASAMNINQYGVIPDMPGVREKCIKMAAELYEEYSRKL